MGGKARALVAGLTLSLGRAGSQDRLILEVELEPREYSTSGSCNRNAVVASDGVAVEAGVRMSL